MAFPDIEAQLSYAYLTAAASHAGIACQEGTRSLDNAGVDATLHLIKNFGSDQLVLSRAAYWVSLLDAPPSTNTSGQTIYLPKTQPLSPTGLHDLFRRVAHQERLRYEH